MPLHISHCFHNRFLYTRVPPPLTVQLSLFLSRVNRFSAAENNETYLVSSSIVAWHAGRVGFNHSMCPWLTREALQMHQLRLWPHQLSACWSHRRGKFWEDFGRIFHNLHEFWSFDIAPSHTIRCDVMGTKQWSCMTLIYYCRDKPYNNNYNKKTRQVTLSFAVSK